MTRVKRMGKACLLAAALFLAVIGGSGAALGQSELLPNGSLEQLRDTEIVIDGQTHTIRVPVGYKAKQFHNEVTRPLTRYFIIDEDVARSGNRSVHIVGGGGSSRIALMRTMPIEGGHSYRFMVWYRSEKGVVWDQPPRYIRARFQVWEGSRKLSWDPNWIKDMPPGTTAELTSDGGGVYLMSTRQGEQDGGWYPLGALMALPKGVTQIEIAVFNWYGRESVWIDDISLEKVSR